MTSQPYTFPTPANLSDSERQRFLALVDAFAGQIAPSGMVFFSPVRGRKFVLLWQAGFRVAGHWNDGVKPRVVYSRGDGPKLARYEAVKEAEAASTFRLPQTLTPA